MWCYHYHFVQGGTGKMLRLIVTKLTRANESTSNLANSENSRVITSGPPHDEGIGNASTTLCCG